MSVNIKGIYVLVFGRQSHLYPKSMTKGICKENLFSWRCICVLFQCRLAIWTMGKLSMVDEGCPFSTFSDFWEKCLTMPYDPEAPLLPPKRIISGLFSSIVIVLNAHSPFCSTDVAKNQIEPAAIFSIFVWLGILFVSWNTFQVMHQDALQTTWCLRVN